MRAFIRLFAVIAISAAVPQLSLADGALQGKRGGPSPSEKPSISQNRASAAKGGQARPGDSNSTPTFQFQPPNFNAILSQSVIDRLRQTKRK